MDLDNLKNSWQEYDQKLEKSLRLNEQLLRQLNLNQSRNEMRTPLIWECVGLIGTIFFMILFTPIIIRNSGDLRFLLTGLVAIVFFFISSYNGIRKIKLLTGIDYYNSSILDIQKSILKFEKLYHKIKKIELLSASFILFTTLALVFKGVGGINLFEHPLLFSGHFFSCLIVALPVSLWIYKQCYEKKIKKVYEFLNNIKEFEKEQA